MSVEQGACGVHAEEYTPLDVLFGMPLRTHTPEQAPECVIETNVRQSTLEGDCMRTRAAVALEAGNPLNRVAVFVGQNITLFHHP